MSLNLTCESRLTVIPLSLNLPFGSCVNIVLCVGRSGMNLAALEKRGSFVKALHINLFTVRILLDLFCILCRHT